MPDLDQIKQAEQGARDRRGRFGRGRSGNPEGRAAAATTSTALFAGEGEALTRKAVELALAGAPAALRGCASDASSGRIANLRSNSGCRQSATPPIWPGQSVKADPTEAGGSERCVGPASYTPCPKMAPFALYRLRMSDPEWADA